MHASSLFLELLHCSPSKTSPTWDMQFRDPTSRVTIQDLGPRWWIEIRYISSYERASCSLFLSYGHFLVTVTPWDHTAQIREVPPYKIPGHSKPNYMYLTILPHALARTCMNVYCTNRMWLTPVSVTKTGIAEHQSSVLQWGRYHKSGIFRC